MNKLKELEQTPPECEQPPLRGSLYSKQFTADFAASFQAAVIKMIVRRFNRAIELHHPKSVLLGGGVVSNIEIRTAVRRAARSHGLKVHVPYSRKLFTDNAGMIGVAAWHQAQRDDLVTEMKTLDRKPNLNFPTPDHPGVSGLWPGA